MDQETTEFFVEEFASETESKLPELPFSPAVSRRSDGEEVSFSGKGFSGFIRNNRAYALPRTCPAVSHATLRVTSDANKHDALLKAVSEIFKVVREV